MIGGLGTVTFSAVVVVAFVVVVCFVVAFGFAVDVTLVVVVAVLCVCIAVVVSLSCSVIGVAVVVIDVVALTGSCRADTGLLSVGCVVSRLVLSVADVGAVRVVTVLVVVVVTAGVCVVIRRVAVALLSAAVTLSVGFSLSVIVIAEDEVAVVVTTSALGSADCAQPDSSAASISIAIAFFISVTPIQYFKHQLCTVAEALLVAALIADRSLLTLDVAEFIEHFILLGGQRSFEFFVQPQPLFAEIDVPAVRIELHIYRRSVAVVDILDGHISTSFSTNKDTTPSVE